MSYKHLSKFERGMIEAYYRLNNSARIIALEIGRHHSTISREIRRLKGDYYKAEEGQRRYEEDRKRSRWKGKSNGNLIRQIEEMLRLTWSPEQIANTIVKGKISFKTIYNWYYQGKIHLGDLRYLRQKGKRREAGENRGKFTIGKKIEERPVEVENRENFGHWELDSLVSSRGKSKGCFATFVERKSRFTIAIKMPDRTAESMKEAIVKLYRGMPAKVFLTGTTDRGKEFACFNKVKEEIGLDLYFADPYSAWQRGSNENANSLLREFYPKKTDLALIDEKKLNYNLFLINSRPRKCLGWQSSIQVFLREVSHLILQSAFYKGVIWVKRLSVIPELIWLEFREL